MGINPDDARRAVRERQYKNRVEEDAAIRNVDEQVWDKVRTLEQFLMQQAKALDAERQDAIADALEISEGLATLTTDIKRKRVRLDETVAREWQILSQRGQAASETLDRIERDVNHVAEKLSDPYAAYLNLVDRFSLLKPDIQF